MKKLIGALVLALIASSASAQVDYVAKPKPKPSEKVGMTQKQFDQVKEGLDKNAKIKILMAKGQEDRDTTNLLREIGYDKKTWDEMVKPYIDTLMKTKGGKPVDETLRLYVIANLLGPLYVSKPEVIREALPTVRDINKKYHLAYKNYPTLSAAQIKEVAMPDLPVGKDGKPVMNAAAQMAKLALMQKARDKKTRSELPITSHDQLIGELDKVYVASMAFAGDKNEDRKLVEFIVECEQKEKNHIWTFAVEALNSEIAAGMSADRAQVLYPVLLQVGKKFEWNIKKYHAWYMPEFNVEANSTLPDAEVHTGYTYLTSAKLLAVAAKQPKLIVHNPAKPDSVNWPAKDRKWKDDPENWPIEKTQREPEPRHPKWQADPQESSLFGAHGVYP